MNLVAELKRRNVIRMAGLYLVGAWLVVQVSSTLLPMFDAPAWLPRGIVVILAIGLVPALVFAWVFELTPQGLKRDAEVKPEESIAPQTAQRMNRAIIAILLLALVYFGFDKFVLAPQREAQIALAATSPAKPPATVVAQVVDAKSIAVLPMDNDSRDKDQQYFSDGLSEDLITALAQFAGLKVISRNSSFQFRNSTDDSKTIGDKLGVAHLLEGSVRHAGDMVRISAELVNAADGSTSWSQRYDRPYRDLFALQDDIANAVAGALKAKLLESGSAVAQGERPPDGNLDAWNAYSRGRFHAALGDPADARKAIDFYTQAIALDPRYAQAYASLAYTWASLAATFLGGAEQREGYAKARVAVDQALQLDPDLAKAHVAHALLLQWADFDWTGAEAAYRRAFELAPNDNLSTFGLGRVSGVLGHPRQAIPLIRQSIAIDPRSGSAWYWLAWNLAATGDLEEAENAARKAIDVMPGKPFLPTGLAIIQVQRGETAAALDSARREPPGQWRDIALAFALQGGNDRAPADAALKNLIASAADGSAYQIAEVYALRGDADSLFRWLDRARDTRDPGIGRLLTDSFILRYRNDARFAAFCRKVGLPTTTDAKALP